MHFAFGLVAVVVPTVAVALPGAGARSITVRFAPFDVQPNSDRDAEIPAAARTGIVGWLAPVVE